MKKLRTILNMKSTWLSFIFTFTFYLSPFSCSAQYTVLHNFNDTNGAEPTDALTLSGSVLYGMTYHGGTYNAGTIFSVNTDGSRYTTLHNFNFNDTNGSTPEGDLTLSGGVLYGMTGFGGAYNGGVIFSIDTNGSGYAVLLDFNGKNGASPDGSLTLSRSVLYGMTTTGDTNDGCIFSINTDGSGYTTLHNFNDTNGAWPDGSLTLSGSVLYGMTSGGGTNKNAGVIFSIDTNGSGYTVLHDFNRPNGANPYGDLTLSGSILYGMTYSGGAKDSGVIFSINTNGSGYTILHDFDDTNGANPSGDLMLMGSLLCGMTQYGGTNDSGVIFSINTNGSGYTDLFNFNGTNGAMSGGSLTLLGSTFYGMTFYGGANHYGVIFGLKEPGLGINEVTPPSGAVNVYPNPSNGIFTLSCHSERSEESLPFIKVYNILGEQVLTETLRSAQGDNNINISNQPNGVYLYRVLNADGSLVEEGKLVIQK